MCGRFKLYNISSAQSINNRFLPFVITKNPTINRIPANVQLVNNLSNFK